MIIYKSKEDGTFLAYKENNCDYFKDMTIYEPVYIKSELRYIRRPAYKVVKVYKKSVLLQKI